MSTKQAVTPNPLFERIAREHLGVETLTRRNMDRLDFSEVSVCGFSLRCRPRLTLACNLSRW